MASLSNDDSVSLSSPLLLACGQTLPNRTAKAALSECMADGSTNLPNKELHTLYARWAKGGIGETHSGGDAAVWLSEPASILSPSSIIQPR